MPIYSIGTKSFCFAIPFQFATIWISLFSYIITDMRSTLWKLSYYNTLKAGFQHYLYNNVINTQQDLWFDSQRWSQNDIQRKRTLLALYGSRKIKARFKNATTKNLESAGNGWKTPYQATFKCGASMELCIYYLFRRSETVRAHCWSRRVLQSHNVRQWNPRYRSRYILRIESIRIFSKLSLTLQNVPSFTLEVLNAHQTQPILSQWSTSH